MGWNGWVIANIGWLAIALAVLAIAALALSGWLAVRLSKAEQRYARLTMGVEGGNLQQLLDAHVTELRAAMDCVKEVDALARGLDRAGRRHMQRVGFLRFNPFRDAGGDQSFSLALTDNDGNGFVLSSLRSRENALVYGKPLVGWSSMYPLTDEEKQAIDKARQEPGLSRPSGG
jgi:hypothetical protein